ncbi:MULTISPECIES: hypothetical protein [Halocynthiibacter]|uniref:DUF6854 domain-containing protein n=1 Tax=Halocynthiibacter halioticoli TaxID=2986804 RepID=A0AAE3LUB7_9RHOB|nr:MULTISPECIES: hypothetical protein [Halocynthiibacter]MCV6823560.1 hypothetical protein [Halocynthiibacter halioticoli]MCW4056561.1 hypothetical protein [Halocynthiibacter sp. SDUM655004]
MTTPHYMMVTVAACDQSFVGQALKNLSQLCEDLKSGAGAVTTRYGIMATGEYTGQLILFQTYEEMNGIGAAFDVYSNSDAYKTIVGSGHVSVTLRNVMKIEDVGLPNPSTDVPAYGVVSRWGASDLKLDAIRDHVPHFADNGAMIFRYCTILTGLAAGRRLMAVGYPSMDSIQKTYESLRSSKGYAKMLEEIDLDWRNVVRIEG